MDDLKILSLHEARLKRRMQRSRWMMCRRDPATMYPPHDGGACECVPVPAVSEADAHAATVEAILEDMDESLRFFGRLDLERAHRMIQNEIERRP